MTEGQLDGRTMLKGFLIVACERCSLALCFRPFVVVQQVRDDGRLTCHGNGADHGRTKRIEDGKMADRYAFLG